MSAQSGREHDQLHTLEGAETAWGLSLSPSLSSQRARVLLLSTYVVDGHPLSMDDREGATEYLRAEESSIIPDMGSTPYSTQQQERQE